MSTPSLDRWLSKSQMTKTKPARPRIRPTCPSPEYDTNEIVQLTRPKGYYDDDFDQEDIIPEVAANAGKEGKDSHIRIDKLDKNTDVCIKTEQRPRKLPILDGLPEGPIHEPAPPLKKRKAVPVPSSSSSPSQASSSTHSSPRMKTRSSLSSTIDTSRFERKAEELLQQANDRNYEMRPDLYRLTETDTVMFAVDSLSDERPPLPSPPKIVEGTKFYGEDGYVNLPWSPEYISKDGLHMGKIFMRELTEAANKGFGVLEDFRNLLWRIRVAKGIPALYRLYRLMPKDQRDCLLDLLQDIVNLAVRGPELFTKRLPILKTTPWGPRECSVSLSQEQCACLLACSFLGIMPKSQSDFNSNDLSVFMRQTDEVYLRKLQFILNYFAAIMNHMPTGAISIRRVYNKTSIKINDEKYWNATLSHVGITSKAIEECYKVLQVDFANEYIGGGVLGTGFVQEEIRFLCWPEMIVSMMLCPRMEEREAIFIAGAQQYSSYNGYGTKTTLKPFNGVHPPRDKFKRIMCEVVAIDAKYYNRKWGLRNQYSKESYKRETTKAIAGFTTDLEYKAPVATGNWGCGAFNGDLQLKCILQLIAATVAGRDIIYCPFGERDLASRFCDLVDRLKKKGILLGNLIACLQRYEFKVEYTFFQYVEDMIENWK